MLARPRPLTTRSSCMGGGVVIKIERDEESAHVNKKPRDRKEIVKQVHAIKFDHEI